MEDFLLALLTLTLLALLALAVFAISLLLNLAWAHKLAEQLKTHFSDTGDPPEDADIPPPPILSKNPELGVILDDNDSFSIKIEAGAVAPQRRKQQLNISDKGPVEFLQYAYLGDPEPIRHRLYVSPETKAYLFGSLDSVLLQGDTAKTNQWVGGDFVQIEISRNSQKVKVALFNAYDSVVCNWLSDINATLPHTMQISYSQLAEEDTFAQSAP